MIKKLFIASVRSKKEKQISRYMQEVREIGESGLTRREMMKMGLFAGAGSLVAMAGGKDILGSKALASTALISPPCNYPWSDPLYIPPVVQPLDAVNGLDPVPVAIPNPQFPLLRSIDGVNYQEARVEEHQRWGETWKGVSLTPKPANQFGLWAAEIPFASIPTRMARANIVTCGPMSMAARRRKESRRCGWSPVTGRPAWCAWSTGCR